jgi:plasmid stabilization system protein ParE
MTYRFLASAVADSKAAIEYYDGVSPGLGLGFVAELERTLERILLNPEAWARVSDGHRRCRLRRFPYGVIYSVTDDTVLVAAVYHLHRRPGSWSERS